MPTFSALHSSIRSLLVLMIVVGNLGLRTAHAQQTIQSIEIVGPNNAQPVDTATFPTVSMQLRVLDTNGKPVPNLNLNNLSITESNQPINVSTASLTSESVGTQVVFVLHPTVGRMTSAGLTRATRWDETKQIISAWLDKMRPEDQMAFVVQTANGPQEVISLTSNTNLVRQRLEQYSPSSTNTNGPGPISAMQFAAEAILSKATNSDNRHQVVILISPAYDFKDGEANFITTATEAGIAVSALQLSSNTPYSPLINAINAKQLPQNQGEYIQYLGLNSLASLYTSIEAQRTIYRLTYTSQDLNVTQREVIISAQSSGARASDSVRYTPPSSQQGSAVFTGALPNGNPWQNGFLIERHAPENTDQPGSIPPLQATVGVRVTPPYAGAKLLRAELLVNERVQTTLDNPPGMDLNFTWTLDQFTPTSPTTDPVKSAVNLAVRLTFDGNFAGNGQVYAQIVGTVSSHNPNPPPPPTQPICQTEKSIPWLGDPYLYDLCLAGFTLPVMVQSVLIVILMVMVVILWLNRGKVVAVSREAATRMTDFVRRVTKQVGSGTPKAKLVALQGLDAGGRTEFDIFGETPVGSSPEKAQLLFHMDRPSTPISGLHCTIHEEEISGQWTIEDEDSRNGTYINGKKLRGFGQREPLNHGDVIELAPVERGGVRLRFEVLGATSVEASPDKIRDTVVRNDQKTASPDDLDDFIPTASGSARETKFNRPTAKKTGDALDDFDPTRQDF